MVPKLFQKRLRNKQENSEGYCGTLWIKYISCFFLLFSSFFLFKSWLLVSLEFVKKNKSLNVWHWRPSPYSLHPSRKSVIRLRLPKNISFLVPLQPFYRRGDEDETCKRKHICSNTHKYFLLLLLLLLGHIFILRGVKSVTEFNFQWWLFSSHR